MKQVTINLYSFAELSEDAQQNAIESYRNSNDPDDSYIYDSAHDTVNAFHKMFGTKEGLRSWLDVRINEDDNILNLTGLRLRTWIINNFPNLYEGKYFSLWSKKDITYKHHKDGYPVLKSRHSKIIKSNSCVLTGVCYDDDLLNPIYDFIDRYKEKADYYSYMNYETLITDCFAELERVIEEECSYNNSDEAIAEHLTINEYQFTEDGEEL